jgi:hypothetical protein
VTEKFGLLTGRSSEFYEEDLPVLKKRKNSYIIYSILKLSLQIELRPYRIIHKMSLSSKIFTEKLIFFQQAKNFRAICSNKRPLTVYIT